MRKLVTVVGVCLGKESTFYQKFVFIFILCVRIQRRRGEVQAWTERREKGVEGPIVLAPLFHLIGREVVRVRQKARHGRIFLKIYYY